MCVTPMFMGKFLLIFLLENNLCILNGRLTPELDDFTSISVRGKAVVDYFVTRHDCFESFSKAHVSTTTGLLDKFNLYDLIDNNCKPPDHSVISVILDYTALHDNCEETYTLRTVNNVNMNDMVVCKQKRYHFIDIPSDFQNNDTWKRSTSLFIDKCIYLQNNQDEMNKLYTEFCNILTYEMDTFLKHSCTSGKTRNCKSQKPYWNDTLSRYWKEMKMAERQFLRSKNRHNSILHNEFIIKRKTFMRELRKCERMYRHQQLSNLENICVSDPKIFWQTIKKLGPRKSNVIPEQVYIDGVLSDNISLVLQKWKEDFYSLYNNRDGNELFCQNFLEYTKNKIRSFELEMCENNYVMNGLLNLPISIQEIQYMVKRLKRNKASGIDNIPYEILMNEDVVKILFNLYSKCFTYGKTPSVWLQAIIAPIPKGGNKDPFVPTNYRGISLLSCVCKGYTNILNNRLSSYFETIGILVDEQNGFRPNRACIDHIYCITTIIRNRFYKSQPTFSCFIDFQKAFDYVDRNLLLYRLLLYKVDGNMYNAIKSIYKETQSTIRLNGKFTQWFNIGFGVRQGDALSTTLFSAFINDLAEEIKSLNIGINIDNDIISTLFYADDIVLLAENENNLQKMLDCVYNWCSKWRMTINIDKTNVIHFRKKRNAMTNHEFKLGGATIRNVKEYKYLGVLLNEFMDFNSTAELLSGAAGRALGGLINKFKTFRNAGYASYKKLFHTNICPILDYCSGVWGFKNYSLCEKIQYRAQRWFLGVHNKTPLAAISGDMGWVTSQNRRHLNMLRLWNRLVKFEESKLVKRIFIWDLHHSNNNWGSEIKSIMENINMTDHFYNKTTVDLKLAENTLNQKTSLTWKSELQIKPKLRTYIKFKENFETESYVKFCINRLQRSLLAQLRSGTLPLNIETGRFRNIDVENRKCTLCNHNTVENEVHFVCECPVYDDHRSIMYNEILNKHPDFVIYFNQDKFNYIVKYEWKLLAKYLESAWKTRNNKLYQTS